MTRPRAADDFATIRARLDELRRERAQANTPEKDARADRLRSRREDGSAAETERQHRARREGWPPPWVPTIFAKRSQQ